jgi:hypothetical protein
MKDGSIQIPLMFLRNTFMASVMGQVRRRDYTEGSDVRHFEIFQDRRGPKPACPLYSVDLGT